MRLTIWGAIAGFAIGVCVIVCALAFSAMPGGSAKSIVPTMGMCGLTGGVVGFVIASMRE
jgi:hypothetical protein